MSVFPSKVRPGGTVVFHQRIQPSDPVWLYKSDYVLDPNGQKIPSFQGLLPALPIYFKKDERDLILKSDIGYQAHPILMAARYLAPESRDPDFFVDTLLSLKNATHYYPTFQVPTDGPLGRYELVSETFLNGEKLGSSTAKYDYFLVENLRLVDFRPVESGYEAHVDNASPEPVLARLHDPSKEPRDQTTLLELPPRSVTPIRLGGNVALLFYCGGSEALKLAPEDEPLVVRNPRVRAVRKFSGTTYLFATREEPERAFELDVLGSEIWNLADGFALRGSVRTSENAAVYDAMLADGLIQETQL